jgi:hypothetical protein
VPIILKETGLSGSCRTVDIRQILRPSRRERVWRLFIRRQKRRLKFNDRFTESDYLSRERVRLGFKELRKVKMSKYLKISNQGSCYPEAFTVLGVSTARGDESKIGQFGSGSKMGINVLLRNNLTPVITSDNLYIVFSTMQKTMGDKQYERVVANINGECQELGFSTEFGELDWTSVTFAVREFVSNALDQGGIAIEVVDHISQDAGRTSVYIPYTQEIRNYHKDISKYFLAFSGDRFIVGDNPDETLRVYRKGVLVFEDPEKRSLFRYNIDNLKVDESRNADSGTVQYYIADNLHEISDDQAERFLRAFVEKENWYETTDINDRYISSYGMGDKLKRAFHRLYPGYKLVPPQLVEFCKQKEKLLKVVKSSSVDFLSRMGLPFADVGMGSDAIRRGVTPVAVSSECRRIFNRVWRKLEKAGLTDGKFKPELKQYIKPMENGSLVGGFYDPSTSTVYIERDSVVLHVILEEISHHITGASDCTRDFQSFAFKVAGIFI